MKKIIVSLIALFVIAPFAAFAAGDTVTVNSVTAIGCGSQTVDVNGSATYSDPANTLAVSFNGVPEFATSTQGAVWDFPSVLAPGSYKVEADILDASSTVLASSTQSFSVGACPFVQTQTGHMNAQGGHFRGAVIVVTGAPYMYLIPDATEEQVSDLIGSLSGVISVVNNQ